MASYREARAQRSQDMLDAHETWKARGAEMAEVPPSLRPLLAQARYREHEEAMKRVNNPLARWDRTSPLGKLICGLIAAVLLIAFFNDGGWLDQIRWALGG